MKLDLGKQPDKNTHVMLTGLRQQQINKLSHDPAGHFFVRKWNNIKLWECWYHLVLCYTSFNSQWTKSKFYGLMQHSFCKQSRMQKSIEAVDTHTHMHTNSGGETDGCWSVDLGRYCHSCSLSSLSTARKEPLSPVFCLSVWLYSRIMLMGNVLAPPSFVLQTSATRWGWLLHE